ncbi:MAG TPA: hypothetical protein VGF94_03475 [Kofleriaceae bacterium]
MARFQVTDELRAFMREVVAKVDWIDDRATLVGPDALSCECARGGRLPNSDRYRFTYFARDGRGRWELELGEQQLRDLADGHTSELDARELDPNTRSTRGEALIVWGEFDEDALRVRSPLDLATALDALHAIGQGDPLLVRLWSAADEQVVIALNGNECALFVVHGDTYGTSVGDPTRTGSFEVRGEDIGELVIAWNQCVPWRVARPALLVFAEQGTVGEGVILDGAIPTQLLMLGDLDRAAALASRRAPPADPALSSLPRRAPQGAWAERLLNALVELHLIELDSAIFDAIAARTSILLVQHRDAEDSPEAAQALAKELSRLRGVGALFATGGDLQIALRRTQDAPTMPVDVPLA